MMLDATVVQGRSCASNEAMRVQSRDLETLEEVGRLLDGVVRIVLEGG